jgi:hypothetical protein
MFAMISLRQPGKVPAQGSQQTQHWELLKLVVAFLLYQANRCCVTGYLRFIGNIKALLHIFLVKIHRVFRYC